MIETYAWVLPRPSKHKYPGSFPLHFEKKLLKLLGIDPEKHSICQPFGGKAESGIRVDVNPETHPDYLWDAHDMKDLFDDNTFDLVILDPPYSNEQNERMYGSKKPLHWGIYTREALRICKPGGFLVIYHKLVTPSIPGAKLMKRILLATRTWHVLRCVHIHQKEMK